MESPVSWAYQEAPRFETMTLVQRHESGIRGIPQRVAATQGEERAWPGDPGASGGSVPCRTERALPPAFPSGPAAYATALPCTGVAIGPAAPRRRGGPACAGC